MMNAKKMNEMELNKVADAGLDTIDYTLLHQKIHHHEGLPYPIVPVFPEPEPEPHLHFPIDWPPVPLPDPFETKIPVWRK